MELKTAIEKDYHDDVINEIDKFLQREPLPSQSNKLIINKFVALVKLNQIDRAHEVLKIHSDVFKDLPQYPLYQNYLFYQKGNFKEIINNLNKIDDS